MKEIIKFIKENKFLSFTLITITAILILSFAFRQFNDNEEEIVNVPIPQEKVREYEEIAGSSVVLGDNEGLTDPVELLLLRDELPISSNMYNIFYDDDRERLIVQYRGSIENSLMAAFLILEQYNILPNTPRVVIEEI